MKIIIYLSLFVSTIACTAQQTGNFRLEISFNEFDYTEDRTLYYFVPNDYDENEEYPLVVGFRGGPHSNAGQFRDQLQFLSDEIGAIILCPENIAHFNNNEGQVKQLFKYSVDTTTALYNIDLNKIYLTGLSFGGRHAVIVSMDTDHGNIPKLRGVIPFATGSNGHLQPNYDAIEQFAPACICIGLNDSQNFINVANTLHNDITANGGESLLNEIPNVGHTVVFPTYPEEMMECIQYIENAIISTTTDNNLPQINIYPNPISNNLFIDLPSDLDLIRYSVYNTSGRKIITSDKAPTSFIDFKNLPSNIYYVKIETSKGVTTRKVIKK
jgi:hypothetical protein